MIVYKFYKPDCAPCYNLQRILSVIDIPEKIQLVEVNTAEEKGLRFAKNKGVKVVPTLMFENGKVLEGNKNREEVLKFLEEGE